MKPMMLGDIARILDIDNSFSGTARGVAVDSRLVIPGDLFFALPGAQMDGHAFLEDAARRGACAAVVLNSYTGASFGLPLLRCNDVLRALQELSKALLKRSKARVIAVTGSIGKTTTKDFIATLLKQKYHVYSSAGNSNSQIGLPLSLLNNATLEEDFLVIEMGMTHPGNILRLIEIAPPEFALITNIALVHACNFDSLQEIASTKAEIFSHPSTKVGFYPLEGDVNHVLSQRGSCEKISFSTLESEADYYLKNIAPGLVVSENGCPSEQLPSLNLIGQHNLHNLLAAIAIARQVGMSWQEIAQGQMHLQLPERRLQIVEKYNAIFINDSYNASEISVKAALSSLPAPKNGGKRIAVLGEMMELGKFSHECHKAVGEHALTCVDTMLCFGEECKPIAACWEKARRKAIWAMHRETIVDELRKILQAGDVVLLKGSRSKGVWKVLEELN